MLTLLLLAGLNLNHEPLDCVVKNQFSRIVATIQPTADVEEVRLYFKATEDDDYFFVPMKLRFDGFAGRLPRAQLGLVYYFIEARDVDGDIQRTPEIVANVVRGRGRGSCPNEGRTAGRTDSKEVVVQATTSSLDKPNGFDGVSEVIPAAEEVIPAPEKDPPAPLPDPSEPSMDNDNSREPAAPVAPAAPEPVGPEPVGPEAVGPEPTPLPPPSVEMAEPPPVRSGAVPDYLIGPGDILRIVVYGQDALTQSVIVQQDGTITYPLIGLIKAADLAPDELQRKLSVLLARDYIRNPLVTVSVEEYRSKTVFVVGRIAKPGTYPLQRNTTLVSILATAGPIIGDAVEAIIVRSGEAVKGPVLPTDLSPDTPKATTLRVSLHDIETGQMENVILRANDTVFIPQPPPIFVSGEVRNPGAYAWRPGLTVRQAISLAGGFTERSSSRIRVVRDVNGKAKETKIGLDDPVERDDQIIVKAKLF